MQARLPTSCFLIWNHYTMIPKNENCSRWNFFDAFRCREKEKHIFTAFLNYSLQKINFNHFYILLSRQSCWNLRSLRFSYNPHPKTCWEAHSSTPYPARGWDWLPCNSECRQIYSPYPVSHCSNPNGASWNCTSEIADTTPSSPYKVGAGGMDLGYVDSASPTPFPGLICPTPVWPHSLGTTAVDASGLEVGLVWLNRRQFHNAALLLTSTNAGKS